VRVRVPLLPLLLMMKMEVRGEELSHQP
jgi:hypothetical protein